MNNIINGKLIYYDGLLPIICQHSKCQTINDIVSNRLKFKIKFVSLSHFDLFMKGISLDQFWDICALQKVLTQPVSQMTQ